MRCVALALSVGILCSCQSIPKISATYRRTFTGRVTQIEPLENYDSAEVIVVEYDPRFVVGLLLSPEGEVRPDQEKYAGYAVHSPSRLFGRPTRDVIGATYEFTYTKTTGELPVLAATRRIAEPSGGGNARLRSRPSP